MKIKFFKIVFLLITCFVSNASYSQFFVEAKAGMNAAISPIMYNFAHKDVGIGYMYDGLVGLKLDYAKDNFGNSAGSAICNRVDLQIVANLSNIFLDTTYYDPFYVLAHAGMGLSTVKPSSVPGTDKNINIIMGISPKYRIIDGLDLITDASLIMNLNQVYNFDGSPTFKDMAVPQTGLILNLSVGLQYTFGDYR